MNSIDTLLVLLACYSFFLFCFVLFCFVFNVLGSLFLFGIFWLVFFFFQSNLQKITTTTTIIIQFTKCFGNVFFFFYKVWMKERKKERINRFTKKKNKLLSFSFSLKAPTRARIWEEEWTKFHFELISHSFMSHHETFKNEIFSIIRKRATSPPPFFFLNLLVFTSKCSSNLPIIFFIFFITIIFIIIIIIAITIIIMVTRACFSMQARNWASTWLSFRKSKNLHTTHKVTMHNLHLKEGEEKVFLHLVVFEVRVLLLMMTMSLSMVMSEKSCWGISTKMEDYFSCQGVSLRQEQKLARQLIFCCVCFSFFFCFFFFFKKCLLLLNCPILWANEKWRNRKRWEKQKWWRNVSGEGVMMEASCCCWLSNCCQSSFFLFLLFLLLLSYFAALTTLFGQSKRMIVLPSRM